MQKVKKGLTGTPFTVQQVAALNLCRGRHVGMPEHRIVAPPEHTRKGQQPEERGGHVNVQWTTGVYEGTGPLLV